MLQDRWEGEDEEDVKDNWDDEDEEENDNQAAVQPSDLPKKKTLKQKIAEREAEALRKKEEKLREKELANRKLTPEEQLAERLERQRLQEESDLRLALDTFGGNANAEVTGLDSAVLSSKNNFDDFRRHLAKKLNAVHTNSNYVAFLEELFRELSVPLETDDLKRISASLTAMYNEKLRALKVSVWRPLSLY